MNLGRPRKEKDVISDKEFVRAGVIMSAYDEARMAGQKHACAVTQSVEDTRRRYPELRISEAEVRRILAKFRPRKSQTILLFERSTLTVEDLAMFKWIQVQLAASDKKKGLTLPAPSDVVPPKTVMTYNIRFGERPNYPRHNRKSPKE